MSMEPVDVRPLLRPLGAELLTLLRGLRAEDWTLPATSRWQVRDVAAHLLDSAVRRLSYHRDALPMGAPDRPLDGYDALAGFLHQLNADWVRAAARMSPAVLTDILGVIEPQVDVFLASLDPHAPALWPVAWAGEDRSENWMDVGREYTERWHHQQQIRDAVGAPPLTDPRWLRPALQIAAHALPRAWRDVAAPDGTAVTVEIVGPSGGTWTLTREGPRWRLGTERSAAPAATVTTDDETAWRLWHRMIDPAVAAARVQGTGDATLAVPFLSSVALMA